MYLPGALDCEGWCDLQSSAMTLGGGEKARGLRRSQVLDLQLKPPPAAVTHSQQQPGAGDALLSSFP